MAALSVVVTKGATFDLYLTKSWAISLTPSFPYQLASTSTGGSSSNGIFLCQAQTTYSFNVCGAKIFPVMTAAVARNIDQEPLPSATPTPIAYQTWAKLGGGVNVVAGEWTFKAQYAYEAFNSQYESHTVVVTANYKCW